MAKKTIKIELAGRKKHNVSPAGRAKLRQLALQNAALKKNQQPGVNNGNPEGHNQYTHPRGAKRISEAVQVAMDTMVAPDKYCLMADLPSGSSWAQVIAVAQLRQAAEGSLSSTQFVQDTTEDKMKGPQGGSQVPKVMSIEFVDPK